MFSRSMSSVVMTETVAGTSSSGRRVRVAAVVTASSCVGTGWPGVTMGIVVVPGHCEAGGGGVVLPVALGGGRRLRCRRRLCRRCLGESR